MSSYILAPMAQQDIDDIAAFIAQDSFETALRILDEIESLSANWPRILRWADGETNLG